MSYKRQQAQWRPLNEQPKQTGWFMVRYGEKEPFAMVFKTKKRSYGDSQWFVDDDTNYSWQGRLPDEWLQLL